MAGLVAHMRHQSPLTNVHIGGLIFEQGDLSRKACHRLSHIITSKVLFELNVANRQRTRTKDLFSDLLFATSISAQLLQSNSFLSFSAILRHVSFGLPLVLLPGGNQFSVILLSSEGYLRKTCILNSHLQALIMLWNACRWRHPCLLYYSQIVTHTRK